MFEGYYRKNIHEKICKLKDYVEFSEKLLAKNLEKVKEDNEEFLSGIGDEFYRDKFGELTWEQEYEIENDFSSIHWSSVFITQYSYIEHILDGVCVFYATNTGSPLKLKDLNGTGIERAKNYISKYMGVSLPFGANEWGKIKDYAKIRNKIVHSGIDINEEISIDKKVVEIVDKMSSISLDSFRMDEPCDPYREDGSNEMYSYFVDPKLELNSKFLINVIDDFDAFFEILFNELEKI